MTSLKFLAPKGFLLWTLWPLTAPNISKLTISFGIFKKNNFCKWCVFLVIQVICLWFFIVSLFYCKSIRKIGYCCILRLEEALSAAWKGYSWSLYLVLTLYILLDQCETVHFNIIDDKSISSTLQNTVLRYSFAWIEKIYCSLFLMKTIPVILWSLNSQGSRSKLIFRLNKS